MSEEPFTISISQSALDNLHQKLALVNLPTAAPESDDEWDYGVPLSDIKRLVARWRNGYDWRTAESALNAALPQFTRPIEVEGFGTFSAHYVHKKSNRENAIPLLFLHGWPGHFAEVQKILPLLTSPTEADAPAFHVVAPSHPGFGFTSAPTKKGFSAAQYAEFAHKIMLALGYTEYVVQGGDWGFMIAQRLATTYGPQHVKAWHTNFSLGRPPVFSNTPLLYIQHEITPYTPNERKGLERTKWFDTKGQAYWAQSATKPQTLGYSLADSPVGLLAWIYEKLVTWTDDYPWEDDEVLTWISLYVFSTSGPATSIRIYYETTNVGNFVEIGKLWSYVPVGLSYFPREIRVLPKVWGRTLGNVVYVAEHEQGGHFAAHEKPDVLVGDVRKMLGRGGKAYGVVKGKDGY